MASPLMARLKHAWNLFTDDQYLLPPSYTGGYSYAGHPNYTRTSFYGDRTLVGSIYSRLAVDVASIDIRHVRTDNARRYKEDMPSNLNECLTIEANIDQAARAFRQDIAQTLFEKGVCAIVPTETSFNPARTTSYDITQMRVGEIMEWFPEHIRVSVFNPNKGIREEFTVLKRSTAIVQNPFYNVMNEPSSTLQRLIRKLSLLDVVDEQSSSGKLDIIIQLPYVIKSEARRAQAEQRRKDIEYQLKDSKYGIAYADGTEKITQLNRPSENNLLKQVEYLTEMLYAELGLTKEIMNGTANEAVMLNYYNRTIEPVVDAVVQAMKRTFLTKTARSQFQSIMYFRDPFKLVPVGDIAEIADKFTRNEILTSNEIRQFIGVAPASDPKADELRNSNMPAEKPAEPAPLPQETGVNSQNGRR